jgi:hypothetical protein
VFASDCTSFKTPEIWFAIDFTSLAFIVPLLALVASEIACVSSETTLPRAESATCNWPVTRFELSVKESSC